MPDTNPPYDQIPLFPNMKPERPAGYYKATYSKLLKPHQDIVEKVVRMLQKAIQIGHIELNAKAIAKVVVDYVGDYRSDLYKINNNNRNNPDNQLSEGDVIGYVLYRYHESK